MRRKSGYVDGIMSGATWGVVAILLPGSDQLSGASLLAMCVTVAVLCDTAAAFFLLVRSGVAGSIADVARVLVSRRALVIGACSVLGGPLFMVGYVAAIVLAGPSDALTATATYPVIGAILSRFLLGQGLDRLGWMGVTVTVVGAALIAAEAGASDNGTQVLVGVGVALLAAVAVALEGIVATRAMVGLDTNTVMAVQKLLSAVVFGFVLLVIPDGVRTVHSVLADAGLVVPIVWAGMFAGYSYVLWYRSIRKIGVARAMALNISYAMWGAVFAWSLRHVPLTLLGLTGCAVVTVGAVLTILSGGDGSSRKGSREDDVAWPALLGAPQRLRVQRGVEPGGERPGESARSEEAGVTVGDQVAERNEPDEPTLHLCGVGLEREIDGQSLVVLADRDAGALDVEPALSCTGSGEDQVDHGAGCGQLRGDGELMGAPDQRQAVAVLVARVAEHPLGGPVPHRPHDRGQGLARGGQLVGPGPSGLARVMGHQPAALELPQPLGEQVAADPGNSAVDLVESAGTDHQLANDQRSPPVAQHVHPARDRAVLPAAHHQLIVHPDELTG